MGPTELASLPVIGDSHREGGLVSGPATTPGRDTGETLTLCLSARLSDLAEMPSQAEFRSPADQGEFPISPLRSSGSRRKAPVEVGALASNAPSRRLGNLWPLAEAERDLLSRLRWVGNLAPGAEILSDGSPLQPRYIMSGWAARVRWFEDGRRQIVSLVLPGDGLGMCQRAHPLALCPVIALTSVSVADGSDILDAIRDTECGLAEASSLASALDQAYLIDQVVRLGRQTALERLAHLFLELHDRLDAIGAVTRSAFAMPLTQEMLADVTGLSIVHVNRTLQQMRREGMVECAAGRMTLRNRDRLVAVSDYRRPEPSRWMRPQSGDPASPHIPPGQRGT